MFVGECKMKKNVIILILLAIIAYQAAYYRDVDYFVDKLNEENQRLQIENERISFLLNRYTEAMQVWNMQDRLRDPFRPDHPTREEVLMERLREKSDEEEN